jgi:hypothetical protein
MTVDFISFFRGFFINPLSESHSPDSPDSLIFFASDRKSGAFPDHRDALLKWHGGVGYFPTEPSSWKTHCDSRRCR